MKSRERSNRLEGGDSLRVAWGATRQQKIIEGTYLQKCITKYTTYTKSRKVDIRLPGKENATPLGARTVHLITTMIKWFRTRRLAKNNLSLKYCH